MFGSLRNLAVDHLNETLSLIREGKTEEALEELEKTEDIVKHLLKDTENEFFKVDLQINYKNVLAIGNFLGKMGRFPQAQSFYKLSLLISQKLLKKDPENVEYQSKMGGTLNYLGVLLWNMGRMEEVREIYEKALEIRQKLLKTDLGNVKYQSDVATTLNNLGNLISDMGRIEEAREIYEKALDMRQKLLKLDPGNVEYHSDVATTLNNLGILLKKMGQIEEAKDRSKKALDMKQKLFETDPENFEYQSDVAMTLNNLGVLLFEIGHFEEAKDRYEKALDIYEKFLKTDPENFEYQSDVAMTLNNLGVLLCDMGLAEEARERYEISLYMRQKLLDNDSENILYQSRVGDTLNNFGLLLCNMGLNEEARGIYEKALDMRQRLLYDDLENILYQSKVGETLNNLGILLGNMGCIEEAKGKYEKALKIFTEPMQYLTIGRKSQAIIRVIELNLNLAEKETNYRKQMEYLEESYQLCKEYQEFFVTYGLRHERKLVMEAGFSAYVDYVMKNIRWEKDPEKRANGYEEAIKVIGRVGKIGDDDEVEKMVSSTICYLKGRKLVNEALNFAQPDLELIKQAVEQFKDAKETYKKANICYCLYIGLLRILEKIEFFEEENASRAKNLIQPVIEILPENIDPSIRSAFEEIEKIFEEKEIKNRKKHLEKFDEKIRAIEYKAIENLFGHVQKKLKDYIEEPFSPNFFYSNWKLKTIFDAEKIKGKMTVRTRDVILFDQMLNWEEIKDNAIEIDYLEKKYIPSGKDIIIFETSNQKSVVRDIDYSETISKNKKACIFLHNCCNSTCNKADLRVAVVQLKYDVYVENYTVKILEDEAYKIKVMSILEFVKKEADIVVFPEFSIPFNFLEEIQRYSNKNGIIVFAGTHYVTEENLEKYEKLFASYFVEEDFRKNICPVVIPNSKIVHSEKMFGAKEENDLFFHKGMKQGKLNRIFKLREYLNLGVLICFEYLNDELRNRLISACDVILVPQTNPSPSRFYGTAKNDLNNPLCIGNKVYIMANGVFRIGKMENNQFVVPKKEEILGGSSGILLTLDKDSNKMLEEGIIPYKEQFVLLATINMQYSAARYTQTSSEPIKTSLINLFDEKEILLTKKKNKGEFLSLIHKINTCTDRVKLKNLLERNRSLVKEYSPLLYERTKVLNNLKFDEIKEKCRYILIQAEY